MGAILRARLEVFNLFPAALTHRLYIGDDVAIIGIEPELVKSVGRGAVGIEPPVVARFALPELGPIRLGQQWCGHRVHAGAFDPANQITPLSRLPPLSYPAVWGVPV